MFTGDQIRSKRKALGMTAEELAKLLKVSKDSIYKWEKGTRPNNAEEYLRVENWLKAKVENVPQETGELEETPTVQEPEPYHKVRNKLKNHKDRVKKIPFYDAEVHAGLVETEMTPIHAPAGTIDVGDLLNDSEAAIRIYGNSMIPNYPPGCVVGLARVEKGFIQPGEVYVIETRNQRVVKRLFYKEDDPESDHFLCYSDNVMTFEGGARNGKLAYPPFSLHKKDVINLFIVTGVIKRNVNSVIINR